MFLHIEPTVRYGIITPYPGGSTRSSPWPLMQSTLSMRLNFTPRFSNYSSLGDQPAHTMHSSLNQPHYRSIGLLGFSPRKVLVRSANIFTHNLSRVPQFSNAKRVAIGSLWNALHVRIYRGSLIPLAYGQSRCFISRSPGFAGRRVTDGAKDKTWLVRQSGSKKQFRDLLGNSR